jgi:hypothetical protein
MHRPWAPAPLEKYELLCDESTLEVGGYFFIAMKRFTTADALN